MSCCEHCGFSLDEAGACPTCVELAHDHGVTLAVVHAAWDVAGDRGVDIEDALDIVRGAEQ
jgi:hypothetical protein